MPNGHTEDTINLPPPILYGLAFAAIGFCGVVVLLDNIAEQVDETITTATGSILDTLDYLFTAPD